MKILIAGDFVPQNRVASLIESSDFSCLKDVCPLVQTVDYAIVNLESPVVISKAKPIYKAGPNLKCSEKAIECLKSVGFQCVTLANNHFLDYGESGVEDTLSTCKKYELNFVGGGRNFDEAAKILYKELNGQILAIINCCENEYSIATTTTPGSNPLNPIKQFYSIQEAKSKADKVLIIVHGGYEMCQLPFPRMVDTYRFFIDAGADAVINHHQHCFSGYEIWHGCPIFYGLGNFCFDRGGQYYSMWNEGFIVTLDLGIVNDFIIHPYVQCAEEPKVKLLKPNAYAGVLSQLNTIILDEQKLVAETQEFFIKKKNNFREILEPINNKYWLAMVRRRWLPSLVSKKRRLQADNYIRCESLRDGLIFYLSGK